MDNTDAGDELMDTRAIPDRKPQSPKVADEAGRDINANVNAKLATPLDAEEASLRIRVSLPNVPSWILRVTRLFSQ